MVKRFYLIKKISKDEYLKLMREAGYKKEYNLIRNSISGSAPLDKRGSKHAAYTNDNGLEVLLSKKEEV